MDQVVRDWKGRSTFWNGRRILWRSGQATLEGITCDIALSGALIVRVDSGELKEIFSGEVQEIRDLASHVADADTFGSI